jgi:hypothetical protein
VYRLGYDFSAYDAAKVLTPAQYECYLARVAAYRPRFVWSEDLKPLFDVCLVHTSAHVPGKVAYFATVQNMLENKTTRTSPEMFVSRFLAGAPSELREAWNHEVLGKVLPTVSFISNTDPDGWFHVYEEGPNSCMKSAYEVRQYAHPKNDLALAYYQNEAGKILNRAIVNQASKTYVRAYGKDCSAFTAALRKLGYRQDDGMLENQYVYIVWDSCQACEDSVITGPYLDGDYFYISPVKGSYPPEGIINGDGEERFRASGEPRCGSCE